MDEELRELAIAIISEDRGWFEYHMPLQRDPRRAEHEVLTSMVLDGRRYLVCKCGSTKTTGRKNQED